MSRHRLAALVFALLSLGLGACASVDTTATHADIAAQIQQRITSAYPPDFEPHITSISARKNALETLLSQPLNADRVMQIALISNPDLQDALLDATLADIARSQASRLPNPSFSFGKSRMGDEREIERSFGFDLIRLITLPWQHKLATRELEQRKLEATQQAIATAFAAQRAYIDAVAALETERYLETVNELAETSALLAQQMAKTGNWSRLEQLQQHSFYADSTAQLAIARRDSLLRRVELERLLGLDASHSQRLQLPERLPVLPTQFPEGSESWQQNLLAKAVDQRLDMLQSKARLAQTQSNLGLTQATRFISVLEYHATRQSSWDTGTKQPQKTGWEISLQIPLFDWGNSQVAQAETLYQRSAWQLAATTLQTQTEVRNAYLRKQTAYELARHYREEIVPLRKQISEESLLRYNGMFIGIFDLLADARTQMSAVLATVASQREFWQSSLDLDQAVLSGSPPIRGRDLVPLAAATAGSNAAH